MASRIANLSGRAAGVVLAASALLAAILALLALDVPERLGSEGPEAPGSESAELRSILAGELGYDPVAGFIVLLNSETPVSRAGAQVAVDAVRTQALAIDGVAEVGRPARAADGAATAVPIHLRPDPDRETVERVATQLRDELDPGPFAVSLAGPDAAALAVRDDAIDAADGRLLLGSAIVALLLFAWLGALGAAATLIAAALSSALAVSVLGLFSESGLEALAVPVAAILAAVLAIESAAALRSRYREEAATIGVGPEAVGEALRVVTRGAGVGALLTATVGVALLIVGGELIGSLGVAAIVGGLLGPLPALVPAAAGLGLGGGAQAGTALPMVDERAPAEAGGPGGFRLLLRLASRRRWLLLAPALLAAAAVGVLALRGSDATGLQAAELPPGPAGDAARELEQRFAPGTGGPLVVAGSGLAESPIATVQRAAVDELAEIDSVGAARTAGAIYTFEAVSAAPPSSQAGQQAVEAVRDLEQPQPAEVTGVGAETADAADRLGDLLPVAALAALLAAAALMAVLGRFRSAPLLALLALLAPVVGLLVARWVFAEGRFQGLFDYAPLEALHLVSFVAIGATLLALGLGRCGQLIAALREERSLGGGRVGSIARSTRLTFGPSLLAALCGAALAAVWVGGPLLAGKEIGLGIAAGLLLDALLARALLAPTLARLI